MEKTIFEIVVAILILIFLLIVKPYIQSKIGMNNYEQLLTYIEYAVRSAEQLYKITESKEKKRYVYNYILEKSIDLNLDLNPDDIDLLVEGTVNEVKYSSV